MSIPIPLKYSKAKTRRRVIAKEKPIQAIPIVYDTGWGDKPIPQATIEFKYGRFWIMVVPPYEKQNVHFLRSPLPGTINIASGKGSSSKSIQVFNGTLSQTVIVDLGWAKARICPTDNGVKLEYTGGLDAVKLRRDKQLQSNKARDLFKMFFD